MERPNLADQSLTRRPLVATMAIEPFAQQYFDELRRQHFPAERNYLDAHITLFHALPDVPWVMSQLEKFSKDQQPFQVSAHSVVSLGNGTAIKIDSKELSFISRHLQKELSEMLTRQDRQKRNFHVTIQNKVDAMTAKQLLSNLTGIFCPFSFRVDGIKLWRYMDGPWEYLDKLNFSSAIHATD